MWQPLKRLLCHERTQVRLSEAMRQQQRRWRDSPAGQRMGAVRTCLPMARVREELQQALEKCDFVVVVGDTGCGKTTQV